MNRFFRTAYSTTLVYLCLAFFGVLVTGAVLPITAFFCLYLGLLLFMVPGMQPGPDEKGRLLSGIGVLTAMSGFLPIALGHCPAVHWLIHLSGIAAAAVFLSVLRHRTTHKSFLMAFCAAGVSVFCLIGLVSLVLLTDIFKGGEASARHETVSLAVNSAVPYVLVLLATGVLHLRGLRAQPGRMIDERLFNRRQLRDTLIFAILAALFFAFDPIALLGKALSFLFDHALKPAVRFLAGLLGSLLPSMSPGTQPVTAPHSAGDAAEPEPVLIAEPAEVLTEPIPMETTEPAPAAAWIVTAVIALILLLLLAWVILRLVKNPPKPGRDRRSGYPNETYERLPGKKRSRRKGKPDKKAGDPRERMRYLYGDFLRCLQKRKVRFDQTSTCGEIRHGAEQQSAADPSTLSDLTALYEQARYRMQEMPAEADARAMKDLLDRIKRRP